jgi:uncharacterized protein YjlB
MGVQVMKGHFGGRQDVLDDMKLNDFWTTTVVAEEATAAKLHWHSEDVYVYVMKGQTYFLDGESGTKHPAIAGDKVVIPARTLHAEGDVVGGIIYLIGIPEALPADRFLLQRDPAGLAKG